MSSIGWRRGGSALVALLLATVAPAAAQCDTIPECVLVWSDEFDGERVDPSKWSFMLGDGSEVGLPPGWGNNELQHYRAENASVADGLLTITAKEESFSGRDYTSARLRSVGKGDWTYGRIEMRARMPLGRGLWPAFWMLPTDTRYGGWAASGEIDVVEYVGSAPDRVFGTIHYGAPFPGNQYATTYTLLDEGTFHDDFHVFAIEWERGIIRWYLDGQPYAQRTWWWSTGGPFPAPFDVDFHLLLNLAVGGNLPGSPDASTSFPQTYEIDYVRVYQEPRSIAIAGPAASDAIAPGDDLAITVEAEDSGAIVRVEFFQGSALLGEDAEPPYELTVEDVAAGCYSIVARSTDLDGREEKSFPVAISVGEGCPQAPYRMRPLPVPGTIEGEEFDLGGSGVAYQDANAANNGVAYRPGEGVDLERTSDVGGGVNVGWIETGEWLEYTIDVTPGSYDVEVRVASAASGGTLHLEFDGVDLTGPISFGGTGGWQNWMTVGVIDVPFGSGVRTLRFVADEGGYNVNWIAVVEPPDVDLDGVPDRVDNCPFDSNAGQQDFDGDQSGDQCDPDDDDDGLADEADVCDLSDLAPTIVIEGCDSGARNVLQPDGCTFVDAIALAAASSASNDGFVGAVTRLMKSAIRARLLDRSQAAVVVRCAERSGVPGDGGIDSIDPPDRPGVEDRGRPAVGARTHDAGPRDLGRSRSDARGPVPR